MNKISDKYYFHKGVLTINEQIPIEDILPFLQFLRVNELKEIKLNCPISTVYLFFIKKYTRIIPLNLSPQLKCVFDQLATKRPVRIKQITSYRKDWFLRTISIFDLKANNKLQDRFWYKIFLSMVTTILIDNIFMILFLFFGIGISVSFLLYYEFMQYGIQMESCKVALYSGIKILCPMFTAFAIMAKSCTSFSIIINNMNTNGDFKIMQLMGLPGNQIFLSPLFFSLLISGPILNLLAIVGIIIGSVLSWIINGNSYRLFFSILQAEMCSEYIIESSVRATLASLIYSLGTCIGGSSGRISFDSSVRAINTCVIISTLGNIMSQIIVSIAVTRN